MLSLFFTEVPCKINGHSEPSQKGEIAMIKKVSIFFRSDFKKRLEESNRHMFPKAISVALAIPMGVFEACMRGGYFENECPFGDPLNRYLCVGYGQLNNLMDMFGEASRMEAIIQNGISESIDVNIFFLKKGPKKEGRVLSVVLTKEGKICIVSCLPVNSI